MSEIWKEIPDFDGLYEISNLGRLRSKDRVVVQKDGKIRTWKATYLGSENKEGYVLSTLRLASKNKVRRVRLHRLVAEAFIPNPENKPEINHINEIKNDNRVENLEWATRIENANHNNLPERSHQTRLRNGSYIKANLKRKLNGSNKRASERYSKPIIQLNMDGSFVKQFKSATEAFNITGIRKCKDCARGDRNTAGGYKWAYVEDLIPKTVKSA